MYPRELTIDCGHIGTKNYIYNRGIHQMATRGFQFTLAVSDSDTLFNAECNLSLAQVWSTSNVFLESGKNLYFSGQVTECTCIGNDNEVMLSEMWSNIFYDSVGTNTSIFITQNVEGLRYHEQYTCKRNVFEPTFLCRLCATRMILPPHTLRLNTISPKKVEITP